MKFPDQTKFLKHFLLFLAGYSAVAMLFVGESILAFPFSSRLILIGVAFFNAALKTAQED